MGTTRRPTMRSNRSRLTLLPSPGSGGGGGGGGGAPAVPTLTAPANGATVYGAFASTVSASSTDGDLDRIDWVLDAGTGGETVVATDAAAPYSQSWAPSGATAGTHTLVARAVRGAQHTDSAPITITARADWLNNSAVTHAWVADAGFTGGGGTLATWSNVKGGVDMAAVASPTLATGWGSGSLGKIVLDGTSQYCTANALAALVTGNDVPWSLTIAFRHNATPVAAKELLGFSDTSSTQRYHVVLTTNSSGIKWAVDRNATVDTIVTETTVAADQAIHVMTLLFTGTTVTMRIDGVTTNLNATALDVASFVLSKFTLGAFSGASVVNFAAIDIRWVVMGLPNIWASGTYTPIETELLSEAA